MSAWGDLEQIRDLRKDIAGKRRYNALHAADTKPEVQRQITRNGKCIALAIKRHNELVAALPFYYRLICRPLPNR